MGTINSAFSLMTGALDADQSALNVVANNVANANTPGYTEETPNWQENQPIEIGGVSYGAGVTGTGATSVRDRVLGERLDQQQQLASASGSRLTALNTLQALFTPDSGSSSSTAGDIGSDLTSFFNSFSSLEANPTNNALRQEVLSSASTLSGDVSNAAASLNSQRSALDQEASGVTSQVNALTASIAQLNQQIETTSPNADAGTLEDQRQQDLSQLSQLIGVNQITTENNGLSITTVSGQSLVSEGSSFQLTTGTVGGVTHFYVGSTDVTGELASGGGQLGGYLTARDQDIPNVLSSLDQLAYNVSTQVNALNNAGTDLNGVEGTGINQDGVPGAGGTPLYIFNQPTAVTGSAVNMKVTMTDPNQIAAAGLGDGTGDNTNATAMANLANEPLMGSSATTFFSMTQNLQSTTPLLGTTSGQVKVYDSLGNSYNATVTYTQQGANTWSYSIAVPDALTPDASVPGQLSYSFGPGETVDPGTNLAITAPVGIPPFVAPPVAANESLATYATDLQNAINTANIAGVTVTNTGGVLTIAGAAGTSGSVIADPVASANTAGTLQFNANGDLISPAANVTGMTFAGLSDGAATLNLSWDLFGANGTANIGQTVAASSQSGQNQNGSANKVTDNQTPIDYYSNFVAQLGSTVSQVQTENTAQNASVTQLQTQNNALSSVNLNDEASLMSTLERSYQAASQVFTMLNTIMASALNLGAQATVS
jgi:flagellar hook-associated protein 1 FlgK